MAKHLQTGSLKTINGQSLEGSGDIVISCSDVCTGGTGATNVVETTSSPVFGLLYNLTDDLYKRIGKNINPLTIGGFNEFSAWRSPTAERQNDADTASPSPLTAWLDSSTNLPFSSMKRYVINNRQPRLLQKQPIGLRNKTIMLN